MSLRPEDVARQLLQEHAEGRIYHNLDPASGVVDLPSAYRVQQSFVALLGREAGARVGYKIGLTSLRMQKMCGIDQPIAGVVFASRVHRSGAALQAKRYGRIGLEFEVGVRLAEDLPAHMAPFTMDRVARAVDGVCAAIEVVDDRSADYKSLGVFSLVADNSWNAGAVLSEFRTSWPDLTAVKGTVYRDGKEVDSGHGRDVLGHPFEPLTWLANHLARSGGGLRAGEFVLTGSLVTTRFPTEPQAIRYELEGIGTVECSVAI